MDNEGWYDLETKEFKHLQDITFVNAMLPNSEVTLRYLRHLQLLYVQPFEYDSLKRIFNSVLDWYWLNLGGVNKSI